MAVAPTATPRSYLLCSSPLLGHLTPLVALGAELRAKGHRVSVLTGARYADRVRDAGLAVRLLPASVDYDDTDLDRWLPDRAAHRGLAAIRHDMVGMFVRVIGGQDAALREAVAEVGPDAVVTELAFTGALPTLLSRPPGGRPPFAALSIAPLTLSSADTPPFGSRLRPVGGRLAPVGRARNVVLQRLVDRLVFAPVQRATDQALAEAGSPPSPWTFLDSGRLYDRVYHLGLPALEYPRRDLPDTVRFVGPLGGTPSTLPLPSWWGDLDGRRVVHVTQGSIDNADPTRLLVPTLLGLAGEDVLVVTSTGGRPVETVTRHLPEGLPGNARLATMLPYDRLLTRCSVMVTNGGYGGVQQALAAGCPLVVAGDSEDKPEVAARVAWSGVGLDLRTGTPSAGRVRRAVTRVLASPGLARAARAYAADVAASPPASATIAADLDRLIHP